MLAIYTVHLRQKRFLRTESLFYVNLTPDGNNKFRFWQKYAAIVYFQPVVEIKQSLKIRTYPIYNIYINSEKKFWKFNFMTWNWLSGIAATNPSCTLHKIIKSTARNKSKCCHCEFCFFAFRYFAKTFSLPFAFRTQSSLLSTFLYNVCIWKYNFLRRKSFHIKSDGQITYFLFWHIWIYRRCWVLNDAAENANWHPANGNIFMRKTIQIINYYPI